MADKSGRPVDVFGSDDNSVAGRLKRRRQAIEEGDLEAASEIMRPDTGGPDLGLGKGGRLSIEEDYDSEKPETRRYKNRGYRTLND